MSVPKSKFGAMLRSSRRLWAAVLLLAVCLVFIGAVVVERRRSAPPRVDRFAGVTWGTATTYVYGSPGTDPSGLTGTVPGAGPGGTSRSAGSVDLQGGSGGAQGGNPVGGESTPPESSVSPTEFAAELAQTMPTAGNPCDLLTPSEIAELMGPDVATRRYVSPASGDDLPPLAVCDFVHGTGDQSSSLSVVSPPADRSDAFEGHLRTELREQRLVGATGFAGRPGNGEPDYWTVVTRTNTHLFAIFSWRVDPDRLEQAVADQPSR